MSVFARRASRLALFVSLVGNSPVFAQGPEQDPFAGVTVATTPNAAEARQSAVESFFHSNFGFRKEIMSQFTLAEDGNASSRQSVGFEVLKKFSSETSTIAGFDFQGRMVRRDGFNSVRNDMEGQYRPGWAFEYHNVYMDFYNVLNPLLGKERKGRNAGRFNVRAGRFYVPFGLNSQTDTHGTVLQLSNDANFGFERDWYAGFRGTLTKNLNYEAYYMAGSGYALRYRGQRGLAASRVSLAGKYSSLYGVESGVSFLAGERLVRHGSHEHMIITQRVGVDARYRHTVPLGVLTFTNEISGGQDKPYSVFTELHEAEYLRASRRWGLATQYRRFWKESAAVDSSVIGEISWYFRNDVGNSNLHWIKLDVERRLAGRPHTVIALQYYLYR